jgi:hypothetical protein
MRLRFLFSLLLSAVLSGAALGQSPNGIISGLVLDPSGRPIASAGILIVNDATEVRYPGKTNGEGIYAVSNLPPGPYRIQVSKIGFKTLIKPDIVINVQSAVALNFTLPVGAVSETLTVEAGVSLVNTESGSVSTVVDRQFAENLPLNGRSFQTLIQLTPGVVLTSTNNLEDGGQFSVNGQRASSNYWMVDGVSANVGSTSFINPGNGISGSIGAFSAQGGTNGLVSVDAMQEFRIQTSTFAPEYGRTPGGQISIVTRSGSNQFHGTAFDYLRNDIFDANDWFADNAGLPKSEERQNDFGGTLQGPIIRDRTFFFFSYEGLRLRLPQTGLTVVPDLNSRQSASPAMQPFLNAFPRPNGPELGDGMAEFNAPYSNNSTLDAYSIRLDHKVSSALTVFGRYNSSPSGTTQRGNGESLSTLSDSDIDIQTATVGATFLLSPSAANDLRFNYSRTNSTNSLRQDDFGQATPLSSLPFPSPYSSHNAIFSLSIFSLAAGGYAVGQNTQNLQRQMNLVDTFTLQKGAHGLKFGVDFRRLSPVYGPRPYSQIVTFADVPSAETGELSFSLVPVYQPAHFLFRNLGVYAQDTWKIGGRLSLTYGIRWDVDFSPTTTVGPKPPALTGFTLDDLATLGLAAAGTPAFKTKLDNFAPRVGFAYQIRQAPEWSTVLRGGFGVFYDLATSEAGNLFGFGAYPYGATKINIGGAFPLNAASASPPLIMPPGGGQGTLTGFDPDLRLPDTLQWSTAVEQSLGRDQSVSVTYVGASGRNLLQSAFISSPNANYASAYFVGNTATSNYNALQAQFHRRLSHGLDTLASYSWSHSIDTGSAGSFGNAANALVPSVDPNENRGDSDFDIRNAFSAAVSYDIPSISGNSFTRAAVNGWSVQSIVQARSAPPITVYNSSFSQLFNGATEIRPDVVPDQSLYLHGPQFPGSKALNPAAFVDPPVDANGNPIRQGDLPRNSLRAFGATQWDFALHREFPLRDRLKLQFRAEFFNLLNHPNFGNPVTDLSNTSQFGRATQMLGNSLGGSSVGAGGFDPLYQLGGPRSIQLALKLLF